MSLRFHNWRMGLPMDTQTRNIAWGRPLPRFQGHSENTIRKLRKNGSTRGFGGVHKARKKDKDNVIRAVNARRKVLWAAGMRFVKLLGAGGFGVAALYHITNGKGQTMNVVIKMGLGQEGEEAIVHERGALLVCLSFPLF